MSGLWEMEPVCCEVEATFITFHVQRKSKEIRELPLTLLPPSFGELVGAVLLEWFQHSM